MSLSGAAGGTVDPMRLMQRVADQALELIPGADGVFIGLRDGDEIAYVCGAGHLAPYVGTRIVIDGSLSGLAIQTGQVLRSDDTRRDSRVDPESCRRLGVLSSVCVPVCRANERLGVVNVSSSEANSFSDDDVATLTRLAGFVTIAIGLASDLAHVADQLLGPGAGYAPERHVADQPEPVDGPSERDSQFVMRVLSPEVAARSEARRRIGKLLDKPDAMSVVFQPIVDLQSGSVLAVEALARVSVEPTRTPDVWFAEANEAGFGLELEMLAVTKALAHQHMLPEGVAMTINVGPQTMAAPQLIDALATARPGLVVLELTEHSRVDDYPGLMTALRALRHMGARLAVDDTGSGISSLAHILKLAPDFIKLDRELTSGIDLDPVRRALATSLLTFAAETGAQILAEGVETEDELETLQTLGITCAQGYYLGRPTPIESLPMTIAQCRNLISAGRSHV